MSHILLSVITGVLAATCIYTAGYALSRSVEQRRVKTLLLGSMPAARSRRSTQRNARIDYLVGALNLRRWLSPEGLHLRLAKAGRRGTRAETTFLMSRFALALIAAAIAWFFVEAMLPDQPLSIDVAIVLFSIWVGIKIPEIILDSAARRRQAAVRAAWPDALDLMLIMVEAGKPIEQALRRLSNDMTTRCRPLAEELTITLAELVILPERRQAYENLGNRLDLPEIRSTCMAIVQADDQGTSLALLIRTLADEGRNLRLLAAEKKGAKAATYLAIPLLLFFLPPVIIIAMLPMAIRFMGWE